MCIVPFSQALGDVDQVEFMRWTPKVVIRTSPQVEAINWIVRQTITLISVCARGKAQNLSGGKNVGDHGALIP